MARNRVLSAAIRRGVMGLAALSVASAVPAVAYAAPVRIMIDPGHGGRDPGAVSGGLVEKRVNLQISRLVAKEARRQGWRVGMTRNGDKFVRLERRPAKASRFDADVFVSVHANSTGRRHDGAMTIYRSKSGKRLGKSIIRELGRVTPYDDIGNRSDVRGLAVLRAAKKPAVIVEVMSVTAPKERRMIRDSKVQKKIAQAIVRGIAKYERVPYKEPAKAKPKPTAEKKPTPTPVKKPAANPAADTPSTVTTTPVAGPDAKSTTRTQDWTGGSRLTPGEQGEAADSDSPKLRRIQAETAEKPSGTERLIASLVRLFTR